jgi:hypothetical protein
MKKFNPQHCIIVFVKAPVEGLVKTRLAGCLGARGALLLYRALAEDVLAAVCAMDCQVRVFYYPANHQDIVRGWLGDDLPLYVQQGADLGERMHHALCCTAADGFERIILVGSDIPGIDEQIIKSAFTALATRPAVFGPAKDGGYYLVGFKSGAIFPQAFAAIDWPETPDELTGWLRPQALPVHPARATNRAGSLPAVFSRNPEGRSTGDYAPRQRPLPEPSWHPPGP